MDLLLTFWKKEKKLCSRLKELKVKKKKIKFKIKKQETAMKHYFIIWCLDIARFLFIDYLFYTL